jgi:membrane protein implicated in regulation of membrane protease activity
MLVSVIILVILSIVLGFATWNTMRKLEKYEDTVQNQQIYVERIASLIEDSSKRLREVDTTGHFSSDDEVGFFFSNLKAIQETLDEYNLR